MLLTTIFPRIWMLLPEQALVLVRVGKNSSKKTLMNGFTAKQQIQLEQETDKQQQIDERLTLFSLSFFVIALLDVDAGTFPNRSAAVQ